MRGISKMHSYRPESATDVFVRRGGFTTVGAAVAIFLSCSLAFFCLWAARSQSRSAGVQAACDAAVLAAQNEVAEFVLSVRVADATLFTMSLTGLAALGVGTVCCCVPSAAPIGTKLLDAGKSIIEKRDEVARASQRALNAAQEGLSLLAKTQAQAVLKENGSQIEGSGVGYIELVPETAPEVSVGFSDMANDAAQGAQETGSAIAEAARSAEAAAQDAADARERAWRHDCGNLPSSCMAERASALSAMTPAENPIAHTVDTWSFSDALMRARAYYSHRAALERPASDSVDDRVRSAMRSRFYEYAMDELSKGRVVDDGTSVPDIYLPELFSNTEEMRKTPLYEEKAYPASGGVLHAFDGCPGMEGTPSGMGSLKDLESGLFDTCPVCRFDAASLGKVAAASTSIDNGFEHHYREVVRAAREYCEAQSRALPAMQEVKDLAEDGLDSIVRAMEDVGSRRVEAYPPGRFGTLAAYAFDASPDTSPSAFFESPGDIGSYAAVSAAVMVEDSSDNAISSLLDGVKDDIGPPLSDAGDAVLGIWGSLLESYAAGVEGLEGGVEKTLDGIPLASASGLGDWASATLKEAIATAGLEPVATAVAKPVVANSGHVASKGDGPVSKAVLSLKSGASSSRAARGRRRPSRRRLGPTDDIGPAAGVGGADGERTCLFSFGGQMTVEAAVVLPTMIALAFILVNALVFVGDCVAFDIVARDAVRMQADDGYEGAQSEAEVRARIEGRLSMAHETVEVMCERTALGHVRYVAATAFSPPFLRGASVFGLNVPPLRHEVQVTVSPYRKGVVI